MSQDAELLLKYLRAAYLYDGARPVNRDFCEEVLGICDIDNAVDQLRAEGHQVNINVRGEIRISGVHR